MGTLPARAPGESPPHGHAAAERDPVVFGLPYYPLPDITAVEVAGLTGLYVVRYDCCGVRGTGPRCWCCGRAL